MSDAAVAAGARRRFLPRSRPARWLVALALVVALLGAWRWEASQPNARTRERIAQLQGDRFLSSLAAQLGKPSRVSTRWKCTMELPPAYLEDFPAQSDQQNAAERLAAVARSTGWTATVNPQPDRAVYVDLRKSFATWTSDSLLVLNSSGLTVELATQSDDDTTCG